MYIDYNTQMETGAHTQNDEWRNREIEEERGEKAREAESTHRLAKLVEGDMLFTGRWVDFFRVRDLWMKMLVTPFINML